MIPSRSFVYRFWCSPLRPQQRERWSLKEMAISEGLSQMESTWRMTFRTRPSWYVNGKSVWSQGARYRERGELLVLAGWCACACLRLWYREDMNIFADIYGGVPGVGMTACLLCARCQRIGLWVHVLPSRALGSCWSLGRSVGSSHCNCRQVRCHVRCASSTRWCCVLFALCVCGLQ